MILDADSCYRALRAHDPRFDGRFFVGVSSTRIYCRPTCRARTPRPERCRFYPSAAAAEAEGYRPCLRCRPELAPGNASVDAVRRLAYAAAAAIEETAPDDARLPAIAAGLGVGDRHLRRAFRAEFGVSPVAYAQTQRLLLAKRLLSDTDLPIVDVAISAGFASLRRFNALFRERYRTSPSAMRRAARGGASSEGLAFELAYRPPLDWTALLDFLRHRAIAGVEAVDADAYARSVRLRRGGRVLTGRIRVAPARGRPALRVVVSSELAPVVPAVLGRVKRLFDLACDPHEVAQALGPLAARRPGLRLPGAFDGFEIAVRAILGQQVTVAGARTLAGRLAAALGDALPADGGAPATAFPDAAQVAAADPAAIAALGMPRRRAEALVALATAVRDGAVRLDGGADVATTVARLRALPGIGEWTAQYVSMRALSWPDAFPHTDLGVMKALGEKNPRRVLERAEPWRPWRGYAVMHLWCGSTEDGA